MVQWLTTKSAVRSTDDGTCAIDVKIHEEALDESDVSTYGQISLVARAIIDQCIGDRVPNTGGYVEDLGPFHAHGRKLPRLYMPFAIQYCAWLSTPTESFVRAFVVEHLTDPLVFSVPRL